MRRFSIQSVKAFTHKVNLNNSFIGIKKTPMHLHRRSVPEQLNLFYNKSSRYNLTCFHIGDFGEV